MNAPVTNLPAEKKVSAIAVARKEMEGMEAQFRMALPEHIPVDRFMRIVQTAMQQNPTLLAADRRTLWGAAMKAAQDGLLPDGRDAALVIYRTKQKGDGGRDVWVDAVQYMPMIAGILKKVRNSGELKSIGAHVVYERDTFRYRLGDDEHIEHEPFLDGDRGKPRLCYAIAQTKDGGTYREVMTVGDVEKVRSISRAKDRGPWVDWWDEMARKTVLRRLSKRLPMSTDLDDIVRRDDALYDFDAAREAASKANPRERRMSTLDAFASAGEIEHHPSTPTPDDDDTESDAFPRASDAPADEAGHQAAEAAQPPPSAEASAAEDVFPGDVPDGMSADAFRRYRQMGSDAHADGVTRKAAVPGDLADDPDVPDVIRAGWDAAAAVGKGRP